MTIRKIVSRSIGTDVIAAEDLAANSVTVAEIQDGAVTGAKIGDGEITGAKIGDTEVSAGKLASTLDLSSNTVTLPDESVTADKLDVGQIGGRRNIIINGAMQVAQRGTTATGSGATSGYRTVDRFRTLTSNTDQLVYTQDQASDAPTGFSKSFKVTVSTEETSLDADENSTVRQAIESQDLQHLNYGTSDAVECSLSFWVKSSLTGTYAFAIYQEGGNQLFVSNYTVSSADTWEQKTISIPTNTTGSFNNDNNVGMYLVWWLGAGSNFTSDDSALNTWDTYGASKYAYGHNVSFITTAGATWQITGVQLEVGTVATPFEHRSYGEELALCQRYFVSDTYYAQGYMSSGFDYSIQIQHPVTMRASPTRTLGTQNYLANTTTVVMAATPDGDGLTNTRVYGRAASTSWLEFGHDYTLDAEL